MDLREQLDQAIGHGPALPPPEQRLAAGRAAVRRRRTLVALGAAAAVVAVVVPVAALGGTQSGSPRDLGPVTTPSVIPSSPPAANPTTPGDARPSRDPDPEPDEFEVQVIDGVPQLASDFSSVVIGPMVRGSDRAYGLQIERDGERLFVLLLETDAGGWRYDRHVVAEGDDDIVTWLRHDGWLPTGERP